MHAQHSILAKQGLLTTYSFVKNTESALARRCKIEKFALCGNEPLGRAIQRKDYVV